MKQALTAKQARVLDVIRDYIKRRDHSPTLSELASALKLKSIRTVAQYLEALEEKGYIARRRNAQRSIEIVEEREGARTVRIPVVGSVGCDDLSVYAAAASDISGDEYLEVDEKLADQVGEIVAVRAVGESMRDAGIESGDYILIQFTEEFETGDRVAAIVNDMVTVKRLEKRDGMLILWPESKDPRYKPIIVRDDFKLTGKVLCVIPRSGADLTEVVPIR